MAYAAETTVPIEKSISEIIAMVRRKGAEQIAQMESPDSYVIHFRLSDRVIRFKLPFPLLDTIPIYNGRHQRISEQQRIARLDQAKRSKARALMLVIKAKLESVESGIETIEEAFLANVVMADGQTVYERVSEPVAIEYAGGKPSVLMLPAS